MPNITMVHNFSGGTERICLSVRLLQEHWGERGLILKPLTGVASMAMFGRSTVMAVIVAPSFPKGRAWEDFYRMVGRLRRKRNATPRVIIVPEQITEQTMKDMARDQVGHAVIREDVRFPKLVRALGENLISSAAKRFLRAVGSGLCERHWVRIGRFIDVVMLECAGAPSPVRRIQRTQTGQVKLTLPPDASRQLVLIANRALVYAAFRGAEHHALDLPSAVRNLGFTDCHKFEVNCQTATGLSASTLAARGGWRAVLTAEPIAMCAADRGGQPQVLRDPPLHPTTDTSRTSEFNQLMFRFRPVVLRVAGGVLGGHGEVEDIAQEVFLRVWNMESRRWRRLTEGYFAKAARNAAIDRNRAVARFPEPTPLLFSRIQGSGVDACRPAWNSQVREVLQRITPGRALAVYLRDALEWKPRDIAGLMGLSGDSVQKLLLRGRRDFRKHWPDVPTRRGESEGVSGA